MQTRSTANASVRALANARVSVLDINDSFITDGGAILAIARNGRSNYDDRGHLSDSGVALVRPLLESAIAKALAAH